MLTILLWYMEPSSLGLDLKNPAILLKAFSHFATTATTHIYSLEPVSAPANRNRVFSTRISFHPVDSPTSQLVAAFTETFIIFDFEELIYK